MIHFLRGGFAFCTFTDAAPGEWPEGHKWTSDKDQVDCATCVLMLHAHGFHLPVLPTVVGDVVQLDPEHSAFGPLLCIVTDVHAWGVTCQAFAPQARDVPPALMFLRVSHEHCRRVGPAAWAPVLTRKGH